MHWGGPTVTARVPLLKEYVEEVMAVCVRQGEAGGWGGALEMHGRVTLTAGVSLPKEYIEEVRVVRFCEGEALEMHGGGPTVTTGVQLPKEYVAEVMKFLIYLISVLA